MPGSAKPLTVSQVAEALACDPRTVRAEIDRGRLPAFRVGAQWRVTREALAAYMEPPPAAVRPAPRTAAPDAPPRRRRTAGRTFRDRLRDSLASADSRG